MKNDRSTKAGFRRSIAENVNEIKRMKSLVMQASMWARAADVHSGVAFRCYTGTYPRFLKTKNGAYAHSFPSHHVALAIRAGRRLREVECAMSKQLGYRWTYKEHMK